MDSFLRWAGSKRSLLSTLAEIVFPSFDRYVEPFAGSACLFFAFESPEAVIGDVNEELINTYREVKNNVDGVIQHLSAFRPNEKQYYKIRALNLQKLIPAKRAARLIYLNRYCFNGLYRTNKEGHFNVPYGGYKCGVLPTADTLRNCSAALQNADLICGSFEETLSKAKAGDFVYMDPPYSIRSRRVFNAYSNFNFGESQLTLLRKCLRKLDRAGIPFLVSYGLSREAEVLGTGFNRKRIIVKRSVAGDTNQRRKHREVLITNY